MYLPLKNDCIVLFHGYHRGLDFFDHCTYTKPISYITTWNFFILSIFEYPYLLPKTSCVFVASLYYNHINYDLMLNLIAFKFALVWNIKISNCNIDKHYIVSTSHNGIVQYYSLKISILVVKLKNVLDLWLFDNATLTNFMYCNFCEVKIKMWN